tara:strand:- start:30 stop:389 length:360 start_codon:yes stop_codon:yes gene_type:complete
VAKKILVIDDEPDVLEVIKTRLETNGYEIITASDGDIGIDKLKIAKPDLIVLDVMMPKMDGLAFVKKVKADKAIPNIPIIILTAKEKMRDVFAIEGIKDYIVKPYIAMDLLKTVNKYLG